MSKVEIPELNKKMLKSMYCGITACDENWDQLIDAYKLNDQAVRTIKSFMSQLINILLCKNPPLSPPLVIVSETVEGSISFHHHLIDSWGSTGTKATSNFIFRNEFSRFEQDKKYTMPVILFADKSEIIDSSMKQVVITDLGERKKPKIKYLYVQLLMKSDWSFEEHRPEHLSAW